MKYTLKNLCKKKGKNINIRKIELKIENLSFFKKNNLPFSIIRMRKEDEKRENNQIAQKIEDPEIILKKKQS